MKLILTILLFTAPAFAQQAVTLPAYDGKELVAIPLDKRGKPAMKVDGPLIWTSSNEAVVRVAQCNAGNLTCYAIWAGEGTATITVNGDGAMGASVRPLTPWVWNVTSELAEAYSIDGKQGPTVPDMAALRGTVTLSADVADNVGVKALQWLLDGAALFGPIPDPPATVTAEWDTRTATPGPHIIGAVATDAAGNEGKAEVSVLVGVQ